MLRLWSRAAQPQSTCRCVSCLSTTSGGLASRTASAASKRRLRIGNSVTALYTSIFAAAALADAQAKDQRRLEWKEKIAAVKEEVNELVDEEKRLLEALAARQKSKPLNGTFYPRQYRPFQMTAGIFPSRPGQPSLRSYHSQASLENLGMDPDESHELNASRYPDMVEESWERSIEEESADTLIDDKLRESVQNELDDDTPNDEDLFSEDMGWEMSPDPDRERPLMDDERGASYQHNTIPRWLQKDVLRMKAIRVVALRQLAIRFLLRPTIAHDYLGLRAQYKIDRSQPRLRTQQLLAELNTLKNRMLNLKTKKKTAIFDIIPDLSPEAGPDLAAENSQLDRQIRFDIEDYLCGDISLDELLIKLAHSLTKVRDPDRIRSLKYMLMAFTRTRQSDLCDLVLKAVMPNMFPMTPTLILSIINYLWKSKNLRGFDLFLEMLRGDGYPLDMRRLSYYKLVVVNGVQITVPPVNSANSVVFSTLILSSLRFDQPDRADAYLQYARSIGYMDSFATLNAYVKFYTIRGDWEKGLHTMKRALAFIASSTEHPVARLERLIALMVRFCDKCERSDISEALISGAVNSGFDWMLAQKQSDLKFHADPEYRRWQDARESSSTEMLEKPTWEKSYAFVNTISDTLNDLPIPEADSARRWQKLMSAYSQQVYSAVVSGAPTEYRESRSTAEPGSHASSTPPNPDDGIPLSSYSDTIAQAHQEEISTLKAEVSQLKRMVFELTRTESNKPAPTPEQTPQTDLGKLKTQLSSTKTGPPEPPAHITIQYRRP
ncbi:hypothetical protein P170DRAFT_438952 [Aspergillus steynii IBT 23096]|uniref:Uncharacterized protein n=1 Tax=Aspergillus steynii IBT 23096 TaxID=1392250 RepID=A0A2I2G314_9EURO|nr:uncharacterized protein P170DRAFT_438952 [Aspergillus steynii IBT 23096]PLB47261.1 hypothetical protein P170DRAFT_438952 [Aspergillus steynii IBT 23096]